jgi:hypothetical protein
MKITRFTQGGAVIHGMTSDRSKAKRISAWFNPAGEMYNAEGWYGRYNHRPIARTSKLWGEIARHGKALLAAEAQHHAP